MSKTFDNGVICASEQAMIVLDEIYDQVKDWFAKYGAYMMSPDEADKVHHFLFINGASNANIVGQSAIKIADLAGLTVPPYTKILIGQGDEVHPDDEYAHEKLSLTLGMFRAKSFEHAVEQAKIMEEIGGFGHTSCLYTDQDLNTECTQYFAESMKMAHILLNTPTSHGGIGDLYNIKLDPSLTLGCGSWGGNSISDNVGPKHLINKKTVAKHAENMLWHKLPPSIYFHCGCMATATEDLKGEQKAFIVTDSFLFEHTPHVHELVELLKQKAIDSEIFHEVQADPNLTTIRKGTEGMNSFQPDLIIAIGGGSPMDAAKMMWILYEHSDVCFKELALYFMDIRKRIYKFPKMVIKVQLVCIPTTSGTGSEVTPFAVVTDDSTGIKYPIADYALTPNMAIVDTNLVMNMPKGLTAAGGIDSVIHALEAYVSVLANEYSDGQALQALKLLKEYLPRAHTKGAKDPVAREKVHNAATIAGIVFSNAFLGVCHSMVHKVRSSF
jgi:acetaldehyde dehydrogenase/alcohol dehydrogenase